MPLQTPVPWNPQQAQRAVRSGQQRFFRYEGRDEVYDRWNDNRHVDAVTFKQLGDPWKDVEILAQTPIQKQPQEKRFFKYENDIKVYDRQDNDRHVSAKEFKAAGNPWNQVEIIPEPVEEKPFIGPLTKQQTEVQEALSKQERIKQLLEEPKGEIIQQPKKSILRKIAEFVSPSKTTYYNSVYDIGIRLGYSDEKADKVAKLFAKKEFFVSGKELGELGITSEDFKKLSSAYVQVAGQSVPPIIGAMGITKGIRPTGKIIEVGKPTTALQKLKITKEIAKQKTLKLNRDNIRIKLQEISNQIELSPARELSKYTVRGSLPEVTGVGSEFSRMGDQVAEQLGFTDSEAARSSYEKLIKLKDRQKELRNELRGSYEDFKPTVREVGALETKLKIAKSKTKKILTEKEKIARRKTSVRAIKQQFGLSDADLKSITRKDVRLMSNLEFKKFLDDVEIKAERIATKQQAMNELVQQIKDKELNIDNMQKAMKLPTLKNMKIKDIKKLDEAIKPFQKGDEFLSVRKLQTVDRTELKGIKTWREARERLTKKLGVPIEDLQNIRVSEFDRFRYDTGLAERNPFYKMMVEEPAKHILVSESEFLILEKEVFDLAKKLKPKGIIARLIPQQKNIRRFMESTPEQQAKIKLTKVEQDLVKVMTREFNKARDYLIQVEAMNLGKENYFTHIRRGILETVKESGIIQAVKETFTKYKQEEQAFNILDRATGEILAMDKFFKFAMHRTGGIVPTENTVKAFLTYMRTFKKKQALDEIVPLIDIYAHALTPKGMTKSGVLLHGNLIKFVKEWLNTQKGRHITLIAKQGGKIDGALRAIKMFTSLRDLGLNLPVSVATEVGEQITTYQLLGKGKYALGKIRQNTKQGKAIVEKYRNLIGKNPWKELVEPSKEIGDRLMEGIFILFRDASTRANKTFLLGSLSKTEFKAGVITPERLASLRTELGRYRMVEGMKSVIGATPEGRAYTQYKTWAIPILRTTIKNLGNIGKKIAFQKPGSEAFKKSALELYRLVEITAFVMIMFGMVRDKDDKTFAGKIVNKAYREATTLIQALQPSMFLAAGRTASFIEDLGVNLTLILKGEQYETKPGFKGVEGLKRQFKPVLIKQFEGEEKKSTGSSAYERFKRGSTNSAYERFKSNSGQSAYEKFK